MRPEQVGDLAHLGGTDRRVAAGQRHLEVHLVEPVRPRHVREPSTAGQRTERCVQCREQCVGEVLAGKTGHLDRAQPLGLVGELGAYVGGGEVRALQDRVHEGAERRALRKPGHR
jgi:hypothetical protein